MLPARLLSYRVCGDRVVPAYLTERDHPWLRGLLDELDRHAGRPHRELEARLRELVARASSAASSRRGELAVHVIRDLCRARTRSAVPARRARAMLFGRAAAMPVDIGAGGVVSGAGREQIVAEVAGQLEVTAAELDEALFADLPGERRVVAPDPLPAPAEMALLANRALAQGLVARAARVRIEVEGNARVLVRHAKFRGLICAVSGRAHVGGASIDISGPFALFRHTLIYGRALAELVPLCAWCDRFRLRAECVLGERRLALDVAPGDPIFPAAEPRRFDSRLEESFARALGRATRDWDIIREPEPVVAGSGLLFPDFALQHRSDPGRRWLLEIVGFWTPDYVAGKLADYRAAGLPNLILCIDAERNCAEADLPPAARVVRFRRRIDPAAILAVIDPAGCGSPAGSE